MKTAKEIADKFLSEVEGNASLELEILRYIEHHYKKWVTGQAPVGGVQVILSERIRQMEVEGWTPEHDEQHADGSLAKAAACYAVAEELREAGRPRLPGFWPMSWDEEWFKPTPDDRIRELAKAGALIAAEIDRLLREKRKIGGKQVS